jgi:hypothetical protein
MPGLMVSEQSGKLSIPAVFGVVLQMPSPDMNIYSQNIQKKCTDPETLTGNS